MWFLSDTVWYNQKNCQLHKVSVPNTLNNFLKLICPNINNVWRHPQTEYAKNIPTACIQFKIVSRRGDYGRIIVAYETQISHEQLRFNVRHLQHNCGRTNPDKFPNNSLGQGITARYFPLCLKGPYKLEECYFAVGIHIDLRELRLRAFIYENKTQLITERDFL